ncbi:uncharacterized protein TRIVIDRAFT_68534 [Trichoderma virens Gv29-8]|uniref:Uncharacterized protein n=1 Tax=Hypocrea virens (strain Gv29-8 / FGSC 10586) TaxID=413071 RepID=G9N4K3_HYPVG|nr:uncharacterized protein TRIVIDRAFT_68534 [Trichoderma virens Gv29-8]EHK18528.1 hypothetical protein TRIVIDRAFT_68534 [Trichoderma virens Gv29-8]
MDWVPTLQYTINCRAGINTSLLFFLFFSFFSLQGILVLVASAHAINAMSAALLPAVCACTTDPEALPAKPWRGCTGYPIAMFRTGGPAMPCQSSQPAICIVRGEHGMHSSMQSAAQFRDMEVNARDPRPAAKKRNIRSGALKMIGLKRPPPDSDNGKTRAEVTRRPTVACFVCCLLMCLLSGVCARVCGRYAQMYTDPSICPQPAAARYSTTTTAAASGAFSDMCSALKPPASSEQLSALGWCYVLYPKLRTGRHHPDEASVKISRGTCRPRVAALTLGAWNPGVMSSALWPLDAAAAAASQARMQPVQPPLVSPPASHTRSCEIQISHLRQRFSALCGGCQPPVWPQSTPPSAGLAHDRFPPQFSSFCPSEAGAPAKHRQNHQKGHRQVSGKRVDLGAIGKRDASTDTSIIRQNPAKETSDHAEVGLGLGWHRIQSPTREGQKWSEGHSDVVRMQRESVLLAIPAAASPFRRGIASRLAFGPIEPATPFTAGHSILFFSCDLLKILAVSSTSTSTTNYCYSACKVHLPACKCSDAILYAATHRPPPCGKANSMDQEVVMATAAAESSKAVIHSKQNLEPRANRGGDFGDSSGRLLRLASNSGRWGQTSGKDIACPMPNQDLASRSGCERPLTRMHLCQTGVFCKYYEYYEYKYCIPPFGTFCLACLGGSSLATSSASFIPNPALAGCADLFFLRLPYAQLFQISLGSAVHLAASQGLDQTKTMLFPSAANVAFSQSQKKETRQESCHCRTSTRYARTASFQPLEYTAANAFEREMSPSPNMVPQ